jgi:hypothetical protein
LLRGVETPGILHRRPRRRKPHFAGSTSAGGHLIPEPKLLGREAL